MVYIRITKIGWVGLFMNRLDEIRKIVDNMLMEQTNLEERCCVMFTYMVYLLLVAYLH